MPDRSMPRFGFRSRGLPGLPAEQAAAALSGLGYDCVELCLEEADVRPDALDQARCAELRRSFAAGGIALASVSYHGDADAFAGRLVNQRLALEATARLGAPMLILNSERAVEPVRQWGELVAHLGELCRAAATAGVDVALEPEPGKVVGSSQDMLDLLAAVAAPRLKVNFDLGHAQCTDADPAAAIRRLGSAIAGLHLEDIHDRVHRHLMFGAGEIDFAAARQALEEIAYTGPYVADLVNLSDPPAMARQALAEMRARFA
jgi:sugar phosphate isomerase/epimerase